MPSTMQLDIIHKSFGLTVERLVVEWLHLMMDNGIQSMFHAIINHQEIIKDSQSI